MPDFDILEFLRSERREGLGPNEYTNNQLVEALSWNRNKAAHWTRQQLDIGNVEPTGRTISEADPQGHPRPRPVYRWVGGQPPPSFKERKLGKHKARGLYWPDGLIEIDERLRGMERLEVLLHEIDHHLHPDKSEEEVTRDAEKTAELLWGQRVRIIDAL